MSQQSPPELIVDQPDSALPSAVGLGSGQQEMPFAMVYGKAVTQIPQDLYIPPEALEVFLEAFEGPLDLLLYLIRKQNIDILDIPVADITKQYMGYIELMTVVRLELAAEYLVMAAMLAEIKSRLLLPRHQEEIDSLSRVGRDLSLASAEAPVMHSRRAHPEVDMQELLLALGDVLRRADMFESHQVTREILSTRERMADVLDRLRGQPFVPFVSLFSVSEGKLGVVVTFMAVLELVKEQLVDLVQSEAFAPIHVKVRGDDAPAEA